MTTSTQEQVAAGRAHGAFHPLRVAEVERLTPDAVALTFDVPPELGDDYAFAPGQHLTLRAHVDGQEVRRSYSICSPPSSGKLRIAVKRLEGGLFSGHALEQVEVGDLLDVMRPAGRFGVHLDPGHVKHYAAIVAGSGITPVLSILGAALGTEPASRFTLVYGNRDASSVMFLEELADYKDRYPARLQLIHVLSRERRDAELLSGRIDAAKLEALLDGRTSSFRMPPEGSVLDATLAVRADAPFACKGGVCGTCRAKLVEGEVTMARHYALDDDEVADGFVLACQSVPLTPKVVLDFDA